MSLDLFLNAIEKKVLKRNCVSCVTNFPSATCSSLWNPWYGSVTYNKSPMTGRYPYQTTATFTCNGGFCLHGDQKRYCGPQGDWDIAGIPSCGPCNVFYYNLKSVIIYGLQVI